MSDMEYTRKYTVDMTSHISLAPAVVSYADRMHAVLGSGQQVASPLAAWLLLALAAHGSRGPERAVLAETLGMDVDDAAVAAGELLCAPHPAVAAAVAIWHRAKFAAPALTTWQRELPERVGRGPVPDQAGADEWARRSTLDLIKRFPLHMKDNTALVLASALATRVSWVRPFMLVPAAELGSSEWASRLDRVLRTPESGHTAFIARTSRAGTVAAHTALSREGLSVTSVVADVSVPAADALAAAHEVALAADPARVSLFDLRLGDSPLWTITEQRIPLTQPREERCAAVLPAWEASSSHDLGAPQLGFGTAAHALTGLLQPGPYEGEARQAAMARYSRTGFEAAAVTAVGVAAAAMRRRLPGLLREAVLRFGHPYAVVAVCRGGRWDGLPVFSAWVSSPSQAE